MWKLLRYIKDFKKECICGPLFKLLEALMDLIVPVVMSYMIDTGIGKNNTGVIARAGILLFILAAVGLGFSITAQYFAAKAATGFTKIVRSELFKHIQKLSVSQLGAVGPSTLITRMTSDMNQVQTGVNWALRLFLRSPFIIVGSVIMAFTINVRMALIFVVMIPLLAVVVFSVMLGTAPMYRNVQNKLDDVTLHTEENLQGVRVIRAFGKERPEMEKYMADTQELFRRQTRAGLISAIMNPVTYLILNFALLAVLHFGSISLNAGGITQGGIIALINYMTQILTELIKMADIIIICSKAVSCGDRIQAVFDIKPEFSTESPRKNNQLPADSSQSTGTSGDKKEKSPVLSFKNVNFRYKGAREDSLSDISFDMKKGSTLGIIGSTGSGKSTLAGLIPRFADVTGGKVLFKGTDVRDMDIRKLRKTISIVLQKSVLFTGTVRSNLEFACENAEEEDMISALRASESLDFIMQKPDGIDTRVSEGGKNFSGGQRQRLAIARGLVKKPELLVLDDSFSALDFKTDAALRHNLKELSDKMSVIIITQRVSTIADCDMILVLDDGRQAGLGTHEELLETCDEYRSIYESQQKNV